MMTKTKKNMKNGHKQKQKRISPAKIVFAPFVMAENVVEAVAAKIVLWVIA